MTDVSVEVNTDVMVAKITAALQKASDMVSFGLQAAEALDLQPHPLSGTIDLPGAMMQMVWARGTALTGDPLRQEFRRWVLTNGFRDATEAVDAILEEARGVAVLASLIDRFGLGYPIGALGEELVGGRRKFDGKQRREKIRHLQELCGPGVVPELADELLTIALARNCLVHRRGVVRTDRDVNHTGDAGDGLLVRLITCELLVREAGRERVVDAFPFEVEAGGEVSLRQVRYTKFFAVGQPVEFTAREFVDVCHTLNLFVGQFAANLHALLVAKGVPQTTPAAGADEMAEMNEEPES